MRILIVPSVNNLVGVRCTIRVVLLRTYTPVTPLANDIKTYGYTYDLNNNITQVDEALFDDSTASTLNTYDEFDRLDSTTDRFSHALVYQYDNNGNRTRRTDANTKVTRYTYDELNRVETVTNALGTTIYTYDRSGLMLETAYPNNGKTIQSYDEVGRLQQIENLLNNAAVSTYLYEYDDHGNRTKQTETNGADPLVTQYSYDELDRLTQVEYPETTTVYTYDANYNRESETVVDNSSAATTKQITLDYNSRNQLTDITDHLDSAQNVTYGFDNNGNQVSKTQDTIITGFVYDVRDQLRQVTVGGSTVGQFLYDHNGLRIEKQGERGIERTTYDDSSPLIQFDENDQTIATYEYGGHKLISLQHQIEGLQFYQFDALGSPVTLSKLDGSIQARYRYDAWGHVLETTGESWNRFGFTGHEEDKETGLIYAKARFYDPDTGRFLNQDAFEGMVDTPPSLHKYLYAYANPTYYVDPNGYSSVAIPNTSGHPGGLLVEEAGFSAQEAADVLSGNGLDYSSTAARQEEYARNPNRHTAATAAGEQMVNNAQSNIEYAYEAASDYLSRKTTELKLQATGLATVMGFITVEDVNGPIDTADKEGRGKVPLNNTYDHTVPGIDRVNNTADTFGVGSVGLETKYEHLTPDHDFVNNTADTRGLGQVESLGAVYSKNDNRNAEGKYENIYEEDKFHHYKPKELFEKDGVWHVRKGNGDIGVAQGSYDYVTIDGKIYVGNKNSGHINLSKGKPVDYAGTVRFGRRESSKGEFKEFTDNSGHYLPDEKYSHQAGFPKGSKFNPTE